MALMALEIKAHAIAKFREGCTWDEVSEATGASRRTLFRWANNDPEFKRAVDEAKADPDLEVEAVTFQNACDPDPAHNTLRMFWLNSRKGYKNRTDVTTDDQSLKSSFERIDNNRDDQVSPPTEATGVLPE